MPSRHIDLIIVSPRDDDEVWSFYSPQIEGLSGGVTDPNELKSTWQDAFEFHGVRGHLEVQIHQEHLYTVDDVDYLIRVKQDEHVDERCHTAGRIAAVMQNGVEREALLEGPRTATGEVLFIAVVPSDQVIDIAAQLHKSGDVAVLVYAVADGFICSARISNSPDLLEGARSMEDWGMPEDVKVGDFMRAAAAGFKQRNLLVPA